MAHQVVAEPDKEDLVVCDDDREGSSKKASVVKAEGRGVVREGVGGAQNEGE